MDPIKDFVIPPIVMLAQPEHSLVIQIWNDWIKPPLLVYGGWWLSQRSMKKQAAKNDKRHHDAIYSELQDVQSALQASINSGVGAILDRLGLGRQSNITLGKIFAPFYENNYVDCINSCTQDERLLLRAIHDGLAAYNDQCDVVNDAQKVRGPDGRIIPEKWGQLNNAVYSAYGRTVALDKLIAILVADKENVKMGIEQLSQRLTDLGKEGGAAMNVRIQKAYRERAEFNSEREAERAERARAKAAEVASSAPTQPSGTLPQGD